LYPKQLTKRIRHISTGLKDQVLGLECQVSGLSLSPGFWFSLLCSPTWKTNLGEGALVLNSGAATEVFPSAASVQKLPFPAKSRAAAKAASTFAMVAVRLKAHRDSNPGPPATRESIPGRQTVRP
jgi:hypothetical protein